MAALPPALTFESLFDLQLGDHLCLPVVSDTDRLTRTAELTDLGLGKHGKVIILADTEAPDELAARLPTLLPDTTTALATGQVQVVACRDVYLAGGVFDPSETLARFVGQVELALAQGYAGLWLAIDMAWSLWGLRNVRTLSAWEAATNPVIARHPVTALCMYDCTRFGQKQLDEIHRMHPMAPGQAPLRFARTDDPPGLALCGEVDLTNSGALTALLNDLLTEPGHITIDATGLSFADLRSADLLSGVTLTRQRGSTTILGSQVVNRLLELTECERSSIEGPPHA